MRERYKINIMDIGVPLFLITSMVFGMGGFYEFIVSCRTNLTLLFFAMLYLFLSSAIYFIRRI